MIDKQENDRVNAMNSVEEYVLQTRGKLYNEYEKFITEEVRWNYSTQLFTIEDFDEKRAGVSGEAKHSIATGHAMQIYNCLNCP